MTIKTTTTAYGRPAVTCLAEQIAALKDGDPLAPVTVVVRSNFISVSTRRALAARPGGIANVTFITLRRLAEQLGAARLAEVGRRPVSAALITAAIRAVLTEAPGVFTPVAGHPTTEQALATSYRELRAAPERSLDAVADCSARAADVVRIHRSTRERLSAKWYDEEDLLSAAADLVISGDARSAAPVVIHLMPTFTAGEQALVKALAHQGQLIVNVALTGDAGVDDTIRHAHRLAGIEVSSGGPDQSPAAAEIVSTSDPDEEVRAAVRTVTQWMHAGVRFGNIAIVYPTADPYLRLLHEQLGAAAIPVNDTPARRIGDMSFGRTLRTLISLPDRAFHRRDVFGLLSGASILDGDREAASGPWERISRAAGVVHSDDWTSRLPRWAEALRRSADAEEADGQESRASHRRKDADRADELADFVARLRRDLAEPETHRSWAENVLWLKGITKTYLGGERRRARWPEDELQAAHRVEEALERLSGLDTVGGPPPTVAVFRRAFESELDVALHRSGRSGDGVLLAQISVAAGMVFERVLVLGMAEGRFPPRRLEDSLLPDVERAASGGHLKQSTHRVHDDQRDLLAVIAGADHAALSHPRGDLRRSTQQPASRWLLDDAARLAGVSHLESSALLTYSTQPWLTHVPSFAAGLAGQQTFATDQHLRLAAIARGMPEQPLLLDDDRVRSAREMVCARRSAAFTRYDGNVTGIAPELLLPERISPTGLESWVKCPRSYLFSRLLRVERTEEPEKRFDIDPLTRGSLIHAILEEFVKVALQEKHSFERWSDTDHQRLQRIAAAHFTDAERHGATGRAILWRAERERISTELDELLTADTQRLAQGFRPLSAELKFNDLVIDLPQGQVLHLRGSIDRVDQKDDGSLEVVDYKTGNSAPYQSLSEDDPHQGGRRLQLYIYARAALAQYPEASAARSVYWFTRTGERPGYEITDVVEDQVLDALGQIVTGITGGVFPARPAEQPSYGWVDCWYCTPDGLSDQPVRREWGRKRADPALAGYRLLVEPGTAGDDG